MSNTCVNLVLLPKFMPARYVAIFLSAQVLIASAFLSSDLFAQPIVSNRDYITYFYTPAGTLRTKANSGFSYALPRIVGVLADKESLANEWNAEEFEEVSELASSLIESTKRYSWKQREAESDAERARVRGEWEEEVKSFMRRAELRLPADLLAKCKARTWFIDFAELGPVDFARSHGANKKDSEIIHDRVVAFKKAVSDSLSRMEVDALTEIYSELPDEKNRVLSRMIRDASPRRQGVVLPIILSQQGNWEAWYELTSTRKYELGSLGELHQRDRQMAFLLSSFSNVMHLQEPNDFESLELFRHHMPEASALQSLIDEEFNADVGELYKDETLSKAARDRKVDELVAKRHAEARKGVEYILNRISPRDAALMEQALLIHAIQQHGPLAICEAEEAAEFDLPFKIEKNEQELLERKHREVADSLDDKLRETFKREVKSLFEGTEIADRVNREWLNHLDDEFTPPLALLLIE